MNKRPRYFAELEKRWRERRDLNRELFGDVLTAPRHHVESLPSVSYEVVCDALRRLARLTSDSRFLGALDALQENELLGDNGKWRNEVTTLRQASADVLVRNSVAQHQAATDDSQVKTCHVVAAQIGFEAETFESAVQRVREIARKERLDWMEKL